MRIGGFVRTSCVDYPGEIASVLFTKGCNLNCGYCHNRSIISFDEGMEEIGWQDILRELHRRKKLCHGVVISGGEPTLQKDLYDVIKELKAQGFLIKLDTNGTNPKMVRTLIEHELLDFIAMDLKAPLDKYRSICRVKNMNLASIKECAEIIKENRLNYEFRTTLCPELHAADIARLISDFQITSNYVIQQCRDAQGKASEAGREQVDLLKKCILQNGLCCSYRGFCREA